MSYDPDSAPDRGREFIGVLTASRLLTSEADARAVDDYVGQRFAKMTAKNGPTEIWYMQARGLDVRYDDGAPYILSDFHFLRDSKGNWLPKGTTPTLVAAKFLEYGVSASYAKVGTEGSAVGHAFRFSDFTRPRRKGPQPEYADARLFPIEYFGKGYSFTGEVREITRSSGGSDSSPAHDDVPGVSTVPTGDVTDLLRAALVGVAPGDMFDRILHTPELKSIGFAFGVPLLDAANDESLTAILAENGVVVVNASGKFEVPTPVTA